MPAAAERPSSLTGFDVFRGLPLEVAAQFEAAAQGVRLRPGETLIRQGEGSNDLYLLVEGSVIVSLHSGEGGEVARLGPGSLIGEMQLLTGERTANVVSSETAFLLRVGREQVEALWASYPEFRDRIVEGIRQRLRRNLLRSVLAEKLHLEEALIDAAVACAQWITLERGDVLVRQGEPSDAMYFLLQGRLQASVEVAGESTPVVEILPGESVGETAVMETDVRRATVRALRPCEVARFSRADALALSARFPAFSLRIFETYVRRQARMFDPGRRVGGGALALVPLDPGIPMVRVVSELLRTFPAGTEQIDRARVAERFNNAAVADEEGLSSASLGIRLWLEQLDASHERLLLQGDRLDSGWTRRCVATASEIVLIGRAGAAASPSSAERALLSRADQSARPRVTLVLLHTDERRPEGTEQWLRGRVVDQVLHLRTKIPGDYARVGRFLTGHAVGVVLSGGAARALAGIGLLQAMAELGIPVDAIGGVSAGAIVACAFADTENAATLSDWCVRFARSGVPMPTLPVVSMLGAKNMLHAARAMFGERHLEDLPVPCLFVSSNLTRGRQHVSRYGRVDEHLYASNALPPILPPMVIDGDLLADGALTNNTPIAEVKEVVRGGPVIALDVTPRVEFEHNAPTPDGISGWQVVFDRVRGRNTHSATPNMFDLLLRGQLIHHVEHLRRVKAMANLYLSPDLRQFGFSDYLKHRAIARAGRDSTIESLRQWWQTDPH